MIDIEIDSKKLCVPDGTTIIEAADDAGIYIPRFCYHKKLSIAANCRMCLVEVEKVGKPLPACATPVTPGMKVFTQSQKALQAQRAVMEFLLINHPLDCPICDQGGECELQDLSMGFGRGFAKYTEPKRAVYSEDIGPLVETEMTRCIHCTRCVRFGEEIAGLRELGATGRGEKMEIGTYVRHFLKSEISGNIIDICPVGALTNKPARYEGRGWEYREHPMISPHDCVGSNTFIHTMAEEFKPQRTVKRAVPRENTGVNETWIADRDRYSVHGLHADNRIYKPRMKKNGRWVEVDWKRALLEIADKLHAVAQNQGADQIAAIASPSSTVEELFLLQKLMRSLGSNNIDHRYRELDFRDQSQRSLYPNMECSIADLESQDSVVIFGSNTRYEQPMIHHRLRKAALDGMPVFAVNPKDYTYTLPLKENWLVASNQLLDALAQITKAASESKNETIVALNDVIVSDTARTIADALIKSEKTVILVGEQVLFSSQASEMRALLSYLKKLTGVKVGELTPGSNSAGAWLAGAIPHRGPAGEVLDQSGKDVKSVFTQSPVRAYLLMNFEPEYDVAYSQDALAALQQAGLVVCLSPFTSEKMESYADFILPITPFTETAGTYVNVEGCWQSFTATTIPHGEAKQGWKVLRALANFLKLEGFNYRTAHEVQFEIKHLVEKQTANFEYSFKLDKLAKPASGLTRLAPWLIYRSDNIVRRAKPLQDVMHDYTALAVNLKTAQALGLNANELAWACQGEQGVNLRLTIDDRLADDTVWLPSGIAQTMGFGKGIGPIELKRVKN